MKDIIYIADLDMDIDDVVAAHYLYSKNALKCIVCDPYPKSEEGLKRKKMLEDLGVLVLKKMPSDSKYVFVGGALTLVADYIKMHHIELLVMNGGFVGSNIVSKPLDKFKNKEFVRTYNFNCNASAADYVLKSGKDRITNIVLVGKNVCHDIRNTRTGIWKDNEYKEIFDTYKVKDEKRQHDMLACHEGLAFVNNTEKYCEYEVVRPVNKGLKGKYTEWGSTKNGDSKYREVLAACSYIDTRKELL